MIKRILILSLIALSTIVAQAKPIKIAYPNWADGIALTYLAKVVLEEEFGADVELTLADPGTIYVSLANGGQDVFLDAWLPHTHAPYWDEFGAQLDDLGPNFAYGVTGLVVPSYVTIDSIEELDSIANELDGKIIGIGTGAGIYRNTNLAIEEYGLNLQQVASSGPVMTASLKAAIDTQEPIVVTGWKPHWKFGRFDLKVLEDPLNIYPVDAVKTITRKGFKEEYPEIAQFLTNFNLTEAHLVDLMIKIDESDENAEAVAREWMLDNRALIDSWIPRY